MTSQVLMNLAKGGPKGSYVEVTLLDIHPANTVSDGLQDHRDSLAGAGAYKLYKEFQAVAKDPQVTIPSNAGIRLVEVYSQQTQAKAFDGLRKNFTLNLWGQSQSTGLLTNASGMDIRWHNLTTYPGQAPSFYPPVSYPVGHNGVHQYYQDNFVSNGLVK